MKRQTPDHPKMHALARLLGIPRAHAVGIMECLWQWTAAYAPDGDLSRWTRNQIAAAVDWPDPDQLFAALQDPQCRWLDPDCFIHDWPDHCEDAVHLRLARTGRCFKCGCTPKTNRLAKNARQLCPVPFVCARHAHVVRTDMRTPMRTGERTALASALAVRTKPPPPTPSAGSDALRAVLSEFASAEVVAVVVSYVGEANVPPSAVKVFLGQVQRTAEKHGPEPAQRALAELAGSLDNGQRPEKPSKLPNYFRPILKRRVEGWRAEQERQAARERYEQEARKRAEQASQQPKTGQQHHAPSERPKRKSVRITVAQRDEAVKQARAAFGLSGGPQMGAAGGTA
jgi:plasmid stabilization system protein ParE